ncbi:MAG: hypothetical protein ABSF91_09855 [Bacteroidota bacterium]|jgi:hypothetical protein
MGVVPFHPFGLINWRVSSIDHGTAIGKIENLTLNETSAKPQFDVEPLTKNKALPISLLSLHNSKGRRPAVDSFYLTTFKMVISRVPVTFVRVSTICPSVINLEFNLMHGGVQSGVGWYHSSDTAWFEQSNAFGEYMVAVRTSKAEEVKLNIEYKQ